VERVRLPVPGPRDLWHVLERGADSVEQLLAAVPRILALVDRTEQLLARVDSLVDRIERTTDAADAVLERSNTLVTDADRLVGVTKPLTERLALLLDRFEPSMSGLQPVLERLAETTSPEEVDAMVELIDHLPRMAAKMETDIMPILDSLNSVAPDLHDLLDVSRELNEMLGQIPGISRLKRRIDAEQEAARQ
jgi:DNA repair ATPase RecN